MDIWQQIADGFVKYSYYCIPLLAFLLDCLIGDPQTKYHPVVGIGKLISLYENLLYKASDSNARKFLYGMFTALLTIITVIIISALILAMASAINPWLEYVIEVILVYISISPRALAKAGNELARLLKQGRLEKARFKLSWIVGRDTADLDESEITRATIETIAENTVDGILSPLFFFILFGPLRAIAYRATNTLDSMIGYKNDKYMFFGRFAAKLDDLVNLIPALIGLFLFTLAAFILQDDWRSAWRIGWRDARKHPSPNGGYAEAPVAGALHIRLGGYNQYFNRMTFREYMGDPLTQMKGYHITKTIRLMYVCTLLMISLTIILTYGMIQL